MFQIKWVWKNLKGKRFQYILGLFLCSFAAVFTLTVPLVSQQIVDLILVPAEGQESRVDLLVPLVIAMVAATLFKTAIGYLQVILNEYAVIDMTHNVRTHIFKNLQSQDSGFFNRNRAGDIMARLTGDMDVVRHTVSQTARVIVESSTIFISILVYFLTVDVLFTLALCLVLPIIFIVLKAYSKKAGYYHGNAREKLSQLSVAAQENIAGNRVVKAFAKEDYEIEKFDKRNKAYSDANVEVNANWLKYYPLIELTAQAMTLIVLLLGGAFVIRERISLGQLMAFSGLCLTFANPVRNLGTIMNEIQRFFPSADKVIEFYYAKPIIVNKFDAKKAERFEGAITFKDVTLKFSGKSVLKKINLEIASGETIAFMGNTGSGKTLLMNLIPRLYDPTKGEILIDGENIKNYELASLRKNIGFATQDVFLFSDTVDSNIAYGKPDMDEETIRHYCKISGVDFVERMVDGFDTLIGERGVGLSGGQKQRLALARALAIEPSILILDDTTSALDMETERLIQKNLRELDFKCTKLIIAQRISTAKYADRIVVLKDGEIEEIGTHDELINSDGYYSEICRLQDFSGGENNG